VVAVQAKQSTEDPLPAFCDFLDTTGTQKALHMPEVAGRVAGNITGNRWINIWATWCKPCIEEMPTLVSWADRFNKAGAKVTLEFVSVDEDLEAFSRFYQARPTFPTSSRLVNPDALAPWIAEMGLDTGAGLPIHIFVDSNNMIRCARAAAVNPSDLPAVERLLGVR
jgi:thiol-disulfide isomerase/thioredoxin